MLVLPFYIDFITESRNLSIAEWLRLVRTSGNPLIQHLCSEQGQLEQVAQSCVQLGCEYLEVNILKDGDPTTPLCLTILKVKDFFLT